MIVPAFIRRHMVINKICSAVCLWAPLTLTVLELHNKLVVQQLHTDDLWNNSSQTKAVTKQKQNTTFHESHNWNCVTSSEKCAFFFFTFYLGSRHPIHSFKLVSHSSIVSFGAHDLICTFAQLIIAAYLAILNHFCCK